MPRFTYEQLVELWKEPFEDLPEPPDLGIIPACRLDKNLWLQKTKSGNFCLSWRNKTGPHTWIWVRKDGSYECFRRSARNLRSNKYLQQFFGRPVEFALDYPEVLGIKGRKEGLERLAVDSSGAPILPRLCKSDVSYEQLTAAAALVVLRYWRQYWGWWERWDTQPTHITVRKTHKVFIAWAHHGDSQTLPPRYDAYLADVLLALVNQVEMSYALDFGESFTWTLPELDPLEAQLEALAGPWGRRSTRHIHPMLREVAGVPSFIEDELPTQVGPELFLKNNPTRLWHQPTGALLAEVEADRTFVLWDVGSEFARKVHSLMNPNLSRKYYLNRELCYARLPQLQLLGPVFDGCRVDRNGMCLNPLHLWAPNLSAEQLAAELRQLVIDWLLDNFLPEWQGLSLCPDILMKEYPVIWFNLSLHNEPMSDLGMEPMRKRIIAWYEERVKPFLAGHSLRALFNLQINSHHDLLALADADCHN